MLTPYKLTTKLSTLKMIIINCENMFFLLNLKMFMCVSVCERARTTSILINGGGGKKKAVIL